MDELVDILDEKGNYTGKTTMKSEAHKLGLFHPTVHVWCYSKNGMVLLQQRGGNKSIDPLKWDVSVAGHIGAGETPEISAYREVQEEIGVTINASKLQKIEVFKIEKRHSKSIWDREFTHTYLYEMDQGVTLIKQESEVEALEWISLEVFETRIIEQETLFVTHSTNRYRKVIENIRLRL
ncbi:MAG: NUDIX domain-containing protein [Bacteroidota bacterium]